MKIKEILAPADYTTKLGERVSYWTYFVGQNIFYNVVTTFMATYLMMNGIDLGKIAIVTLIVKIWDAVNDPMFGIIFDKIKFKNKQKCMPWIRISVGLVPITTVLLFIIPSGMAQTGKVQSKPDIPIPALLNRRPIDISVLRSLTLSVIVVTML